MWLSKNEISQIGFSNIGTDVLIDSGAIFFSPENISIGSHSRIDSGAILSAQDGFIQIGKHVHLAAACKLFGKAGITLENFVGVSVNSVLLSASDDFISGFMTNPTIPEPYRKVTSEQITMKEHALVGANSTVLPGVVLQYGAALGANSLLNKQTDPLSLWLGVPARQIGHRDGTKLNSLFQKYSHECTCLNQE